MAKQTNYKNVIRDLFPFENEYSLFIIGLIVLLCATFIPIDSYTGITVKASNELIDLRHRIVWDVLFFLTLFSVLYIFLVFFFKGFSRTTIIELRKHRKMIQEKNNSKKSPLLEFIILIILYLLCFKGFFMVNPTESSKSLWLYSGNIYVDIIFMFFLYSSFTLFTIVIIVAIHSMKNK